MNLILLKDEDFVSSTTVQIKSIHKSQKDRRYEHIQKVHRAKVGDTLRVGKINSLMGSGIVTKFCASAIELEVQLQEPPPAAPEITLLLALPRPKFLKKSIQTATSFGVKKIYLFNSYRVEKVYWSCTQLNEESVFDSIQLGLEQCRDTILPEVHLRRRFKPFVEDELPIIMQSARALLAHPGENAPCPFNIIEPVVLIVGPEGGFIDYEIEKFKSLGCEGVTLYPRILKVETAISALLGRILP